MILKLVSVSGSMNRAMPKSAGEYSDIIIIWILSESRYKFLNLQGNSVLSAVSLYHPVADGNNSIKYPVLNYDDPFYNNIGDFNPISYGGVRLFWRRA